MRNSRPTIAQAVALALLALSLASTASAGEIRWYTRDADDQHRWLSAADLVWRGEPIRFEVWEGAWPPRPETEAGEPRPPTGDTDDGWTCWLLEESGASPSIVLAPDRLVDHLHVPLDAEGLSPDEIARAGLLVTLSMRRTIQIADAGWMPAADLASLLGADFRPAEAEEIAEPEEPPTPIVGPPPSPERPIARPHLGLGVGLGARPGAAAPTLSPAVRWAMVRGPWVGPGAAVSLDLLGERESDGHRVDLLRLIAAARWQFTPAVARWSFPVAVGIGVDVTRASLADPAVDSAGTGVAPLALLSAGIQPRLSAGVSLALSLEASADLVPIRISIEGPADASTVDLHVLTLSPRLTLVLHPR